MSFYLCSVWETSEQLLLTMSENLRRQLCMDIRGVYEHDAFWGDLICKSSDDVTLLLEELMSEMAKDVTPRLCAELSPEDLKLVKRFILVYMNRVSKVGKHCTKSNFFPLLDILSQPFYASIVECARNNLLIPDDVRFIHAGTTFFGIGRVMEDKGEKCVAILCGGINRVKHIMVQLDGKLLIVHKTGYKCEYKDGLPLANILLSSLGSKTLVTTIQAALSSIIPPIKIVPFVTKYPDTRTAVPILDIKGNSASLNFCEEAPFISCTFEKNFFWHNVYALMSGGGVDVACFNILTAYIAPIINANIDNLYAKIPNGSVRKVQEGMAQMLTRMHIIKQDKNISYHMLLIRLYGADPMQVLQGANFNLEFPGDGMWFRNPDQCVIAVGYVKDTPPYATIACGSNKHDVDIVAVRFNADNELHVFKGNMAGTLLKDLLNETGARVLISTLADKLMLLTDPLILPNM